MNPEPTSSPYVTHLEIRAVASDGEVFAYDQPVAMLMNMPTRPPSVLDVLYALEDTLVTDLRKLGMA